MRTPSIKTLSRVFSDPVEAKRIFQMTRAQLEQLPAGLARITECWHAPKNWDVRMHCLDAIEGGSYGLSHAESTEGEYVTSLNTGDVYADTVIFWRGNYRVQSLGDFVETLKRQSVYFK